MGNEKTTSQTQRRLLLVMPADRRTAIMKCLENLGLKLDAITTCREAKRLLQQDTPTPIVVTGVTLDDGNWSDLLRFVIENNVRTSVVVAASHADERLWSEAVWRGAHDLLVEPYEAAEVDRILDNALRSCPDKA